MVTTDRSLANRQNALRSTGPRTRAGKHASSANSLKAGLFTRQIVIAALGESAESWEAFRDAIVADLNADGVLERVMAERVAGILWRTKRVVAYESAAMTPASLPPHPDEVGPWRGEMLLPVSAEAGTPELLARARTRVRIARNAAAHAANTLELARRVGQVEDNVPLDNGPVLSVLDAVGDVFGWDKYADPSPWAGVLRDVGANPACCFTVTWSLELLHRVIGRAAETTGQALDAVMESAIGMLRAKVAAAGENVPHREAEEAVLVETLLAEKSAAAARALYADDAVVQRVTRVEGHLSRELDRALAAFERVRSMRSERTAALADPVELGSFCRNAHLD